MYHIVFAEYKSDEVKSVLQISKLDYVQLDIISDIASIPEPAA